SYSVPSRPKRTVPSAALPSRSSTNRVCTFCAMSAPFLILTKTIVDNSRSTSTQPHRRADQGCIGKFLSRSDTCDLCETRARPYPWQIESLRRCVAAKLQRRARQARQLTSEGGRLGEAALCLAIC